MIAIDLRDSLRPLAVLFTSLFLVPALAIATPAVTPQQALLLVQADRRCGQNPLQNLEVQSCSRNEDSTLAGAHALRKRG